MLEPTTIEHYLHAREVLEKAEDVLKYWANLILADEDFSKQMLDDGNVLKREKRTTRTLKDGVEIPQDYRVAYFDHNGMIKNEPSLRRRLEKKLIEEYPEYKSETYDPKLLDDMPELCEIKTTEYLKITKPTKQDLEDVKP